ncbi:MAG: hypothetical protein WC791_01980 [Candidatus Paceibacterota bacterium]|jgi:hypothetical protein
MVEVIGCKRVQTAHSEYLLTLVRVEGKLKCICRKTADLSNGKQSALPVGWKCEITKLALEKGKRMHLVGDIFSSTVTRIEDVPLTKN